jgi:hypothetical protein
VGLDGGGGGGGGGLRGAMMEKDVVGKGRASPAGPRPSVGLGASATCGHYRKQQVLLYR